MWAVIVTNQGCPIQVTLVNSETDLEDVVRTARTAWNLTEEVKVHVLAKPASGAPSTAVTKPVSLIVDSKKSPKYSLAIIANLKTAKSSKGHKRWQFCPECGCSWLHHLEGQASLDVEDWDPRPCTECGCEKAVSL